MERGSSVHTVVAFKGISFEYSGNTQTQIIFSRPNMNNVFKTERHEFSVLQPSSDTYQMKASFIFGPESVQGLFPLKYQNEMLHH